MAVNTGVPGRDHGQPTTGKGGEHAANPGSKLGRPAIVPEVDRRQEEIDRALASILDLRRRTGKVTLDELRSAREEGRKS